MKLTKQQHNEMVKAVLDKFDFEKCVTWDDVVPDVPRLRAKAIDLFADCYQQLLRNSTDCECASGGFRAYIDAGDFRYCLEFILQMSCADSPEEWDDDRRLSRDTALSC